MLADRTSMCSASLSAVISPCADGACDPAGLNIGNTVTFQVCVENLSFEIPGSAESSPVDAVLLADTKIEVFLACQTGTCDGLMWSGALEYVSYAAIASSSFSLGATNSCPDATLCGVLSLAQQLDLPRYHPEANTQVCLGTITATAIGMPVQ